MSEFKMSNLKKQILSIFILGVISCGIWNICLAADPYRINFEGKIVTKNNKAIEKTPITFRIYDQEKNGIPLWEETYPDLVIKKGIFNVLLGSITELKLKFDREYYLEIQVDKEIMRPRQKITSEGYAFRSRFSDNGFPEGAIIMWNGSIFSIPEGWALCDGTKGTPDLRDKFIIGASSDQGEVAKTTITGAQTQSGGVKEMVLELGHLPQHRHYSEHWHIIKEHAHATYAHQHLQIAHVHPIGCGGAGMGGNYAGYMAQTGGQIRKLIQPGGEGILNGAAGDGESSSATGETGIFSEHLVSGEGKDNPSIISNLPPYYALAFIMRIYEKDVKR